MTEAVSLIIPIYNEMGFIQGLCEAINAQTYPADRIEALFIDGGSTDGTLEFLQSVEMRAKKRLLHNKKQKHVYALNQGLREAEGDFIMRMDGHSTYEPAYIEKCARWLQTDPTVINVGGPARAKGYDFGSDVIAELCSSRFGLGGSTWRYAKEIIECDTVFPGAWRREELLKTGGWDETQITSQDVELSARMRKVIKGRYIIDPDISLSYFPRNTLLKLAKQYFRYGWWRMFTLGKHPDVLRRAHLIPLALFAATLIGIICAPLAMVGVPPVLFFLPPLVYLLYTFYAASTFIKGKTQKARRFLMSVCGLFIIHYVWSAGMVCGWFRFRPRVPLISALRGHSAAKTPPGYGS